MRPYCIAQGTLLHALQGPKWEGNSKQEGIYVYVQLIHFAVQQKLTQHCNNCTPIKINLKIKNGQSICIDISPKRHTDGQQAHEKMLNITNYQGNAN